MLVLSRRAGESIKIADDIEIVVNRIRGNRVTLGINAPNEVRVMRNELPQDSCDQEDPGAGNCDTM